jgi:uncharacterized protein YndB with AHSA1/START domain
VPAIRVAVTIDAPPGQVSRAIKDIATHVEWMADAEAIRFNSPRRRGVGTTFECDTRVGPFRLVDRMEVTEWRPGQVMGVAHTGLVTGRGRFRLTPLPGGRTRFTWREELHFPWWLGGSIGAVVGGEVLRLIWRQNLRRLKRLVEG